MSFKDLSKAEDALGKAKDKPKPAPAADPSKKAPVDGKPAPKP